MPERPAAQRDEIGRELAVLGAARRLVDGDKLDLARKELDRVSASPLATAPSVIAALALLRGRIAEHAGDYTSAVREAKDAYYKAHSNGDRSIGSPRCASCCTGLAPSSKTYPRSSRGTSSHSPS